MTTGENIPVTREAPGNVPQGSLAAESARKGGAFAENPTQQQGAGEQGPKKRQQQPQSSSGQQQHTQEGGGTAPSKTTSLHLENQQSSRGTGQSEGPQGGGQQQRQKGQVLGVKGSNPPMATGFKETNPEDQGAPAPSYAANQQRLRDPAGPHGKNLTEGGFEGSGTEEGALPEPGSEQDPTRAATNEMRAGMRSGLRSGGGGKEGAGEGKGKSWFTPLGGDEPA